MKKVKIDSMLLAAFLTNIFYSATYPYIHKYIIGSISDNLIVLSQIANCLSIIIGGMIWNKYSDSLFRHYIAYCICETILGIFSTVFTLVTNNIIAYYIIDTLIFAIVTRNVICGGTKLRALRYNSEAKREKFDNDNNSAMALGVIMGSAIAIFLELPFPIMLCIATLGNAIDNIFYIRIFCQQQKLKRR